MKVIVLAGGQGSRIAEYSKKIPKPMIKIGEIPMLTHIMRIFSSFGFNSFLIAAGYKKEIIFDYYKDSKEFQDLQIVDTGENTMTGGRLLKLKTYLAENESFFMTYGDGLCDLDLNKLKKFHQKHGKLATVTTVHPPVRFGELEIINDKVKTFKEKPQPIGSWINGGFFILNYKVFDYIKDDTTSFEKQPLENLANQGELMAFKHEGFWKCMDNLGDKIFLDKMWNQNQVKWKK